MTAIEEMAGMDVLCSDKTGTLTLNKLTVDKNLIEVRNKAMVNIFFFKDKSFCTVRTMIQVYIYGRFLQKEWMRTPLF